MEYFELGVSCYTPATHHSIQRYLTAADDMASSRIFCLEDAVAPHELKGAMANLAAGLPNMPKKAKHKRFIRVRNLENMKEVLALEGIRNIDGFVLPKVTLKNVAAYQAALIGFEDKAIMPTLETVEVFDQQYLRDIRVAFDEFANPIPCVRIGGNDLMSALGIKRPRGMTIYETPIGQVIHDCIAAFRPHGYEISSPVFDYIDDAVTLHREVNHDMQLGIFAKTAIHPVQLDAIQRLYKIEQSDFELAKEILDETDRAVFKSGGQMCEITCHSHWAERTLKASRFFGVKGESRPADKRVVQISAS